MSAFHNSKRNILLQKSHNPRYIYYLLIKQKQTFNFHINLCHSKPMQKFKTSCLVWKSKMLSLKFHLVYQFLKLTISMYLDVDLQMANLGLRLVSTAQNFSKTFFLQNTVRRINTFLIFTTHQLLLQLCLHMFIAKTYKIQIILSKQQIMPTNISSIVGVLSLLTLLRKRVVYDVKQGVILRFL